MMGIIWYTHLKLQPSDAAKTGPEGLPLQPLLPTDNPSSDQVPGLDRLPASSAFVAELGKAK
jgi:hypothetical protein